MSLPRVALHSLRGFLGAIACRMTTSVTTNLLLHKLQGALTESDTDVQTVVNAAIDALDALSPGAATPGYASLYRDADTDDFGDGGAFVDVTGWGGQNCTANNCTVSTANGTVEVTNAGTYRVTFSGVQVISDGDGSNVDVAVQIVKAGTLVPGARRVTNDVPSNGITASEVAFSIDEIVTATAGQVFKPQVYCGNQGSTTTSQIPYANFTVQRIA